MHAHGDGLFYYCPFVNVYTKNKQYYNANLLIHMGINNAGHCSLSRCQRIRAIVLLSFQEA